MRILKGEAGAVVEKKDGVPLTKEMFPAFTGRDDLPKAVFNEEGRPIRAGEPRYLLTSDGIVAVFNKGNGIARRLVRRLSKKSDADMKLLAKLKRLGVPGA